MLDQPRGHSSYFDLSEIRLLAAAFDDTLHRLDLEDSSDAVKNMIAQKIISLAKRGERDPLMLCEEAVKSLTLHFLPFDDA